MSEKNYIMSNLELEDAIYQAQSIMKNVPPGRMQDEAFDHYCELLKIQRMRAAHVVFDALTSSGSSVPSVAE